MPQHGRSQGYGQLHSMSGAQGQDGQLRGYPVHPGFRQQAGIDQQQPANPDVASFRAPMHFPVPMAYLPPAGFPLLGMPGSPMWLPYGPGVAWQQHPHGHRADGPSQGFYHRPTYRLMFPLAPSAPGVSPRPHPHQHPEQQQLGGSALKARLGPDQGPQQASYGRAGAPMQQQQQSGGPRKWGGQSLARGRGEAGPPPPFEPELPAALESETDTDDEDDEPPRARSLSEEVSGTLW